MGGYVAMKRLCGKIAVSRAFGNNDLKVVNH